MKASLILGLFAMLSTLVFAGTPVSRTIPVTHVYSPLGFDTNDKVEVVVTGFLPNLCHRYPDTKVNVSGNNVGVTLTSLYYDPTNPFCPEIAVPFVKTVQVGLLDGGDYNIVVNEKTEHESHSAVAVSEAKTKGIDDFIYANVQEVRVKKNRKVQLIGSNPSPCLELDRIQVISNGKDTFSVLPVLKENGEECTKEMVPFKYKFKVPKTLKRDTVLLHVRSMQGQALNLLFDNKS